MLLLTKAVLTLLLTQVQGQTQKQARKAGKFLQKKVLTEPLEPQELQDQLVRQVLKVA
jgi:hypothetical protein